MEPTRENEEEIQELLEMTRENNKILHGIQRRERIGNILKIIYVAFIVLSFYGAYVFAEPYIKQVRDVFITAQNTQSNINTVVKDVGKAAGLDPNVAKFLEIIQNKATSTPN